MHVFSEQVFRELQFTHSGVGKHPHDNGNLFERGKLGSAESPRPCDNFKLAVLDGADNQRLHDALGRQVSGKFFHRSFVESAAGVGG
jgi:hypothetical protein